MRDMMRDMATRVVVDSRVCVEEEGLAPEAYDAIQLAFSHHNPKHGLMKKLRLPTYKEPPIIRTYASEDGWLTVPRGGMGRVREALREAGVDYRVEDRRTSGAEDLAGRQGAHTMQLWPHQAEAVEAVLERHQGLVRAPTGSGKTSIGMALAARVQLPTLVIVNVVALLDQWVARAETELGLRLGRELGVIRGKSRELRPVTIAMQKTLADHGVDEEMAEAFGLVLCDEVQLFAARTFFAAVDPFEAKYRVGVSQDEGRKDRKEFLTRDLFGPVLTDIKRDDLEDKGIVLDVEVRVVPTEFRADWYGMPDEDDDSASGETTKELDYKRLLDEMTADEQRAQLVAWCAEQGLAGGEQVLIMTARREYCQKLAAAMVARGASTGFLIGGQDYRQEFVQSREAILSGRMRVGVGTFQSIGQGIDLPYVGEVVAGTPVAGNKQLLGQVRGRVCRAPEGKKNARLWYLWDRHVFGIAHLKNLVRWNRTVLVLSERGEWVGGREYLKRAQRANSAA